MMRFPFVLILVAVLVAGCESSSQIITNHFNQLNDIAARNADDCDKMASELTQYLDQNEKSFRNAVASVSNADPDEARQIFSSSLMLHTKAKACQNPGIENFKKKLSDIVLQEAVEK